MEEDGLDGTLQSFSVPYFDLTVLALDLAALFVAPLTEESSMLAKLFILFSSRSSRPNSRRSLRTPLRRLARHYHIFYRHPPLNMMTRNARIYWC